MNSRFDFNTLKTIYCIQEQSIYYFQNYFVPNRLQNYFVPIKKNEESKTPRNKQN